MIYIHIYDYIEYVYNTLYYIYIYMTYIILYNWLLDGILPFHGRHFSKFNFKSSVQGKDGSAKMLLTSKSRDSLTSS